LARRPGRTHTERARVGYAMINAPDALQ
jgi:hypothetical protein